MDPTLTDDQAQQENTNKGGLGQGTINTFNRLPTKWLRKPLFGSRIVGLSALRGFATFLAANSWIWIVVGIMFLTVIVFAVVFGAFGSVPGAPPSQETTTTAPVEP